MKIYNYYLQDGEIYKSDGIIKGIKIVFFSDLHIGKLLKKKRLDKYLKKIRNLNGDVYIFGGDLIGHLPHKYYKKEEIRDCFKIFDNSLNVKVYGNHEFKKERGISQKTKLELFDCMDNFKLLVDEKISYNKEGIKVNIIGLNETKYHNVVIPQIDCKENNIAVVHQGDFFDNLKGFNLTLSGHTHGGQIRLPFFRPFYLPFQGRKYINGLYKKGSQSLIVSKGLGCNYINMRFFANRDIIVIDVRN